MSANRFSGPTPEAGRPVDVVKVAPDHLRDLAMWVATTHGGTDEMRAVARALLNSAETIERLLKEGK